MAQFTQLVCGATVALLCFPGGDDILSFPTNYGFPASWAVEGPGRAAISSNWANFAGGATLSNTMVGAGVLPSGTTIAWSGCNTTAQWAGNAGSCNAWTTSSPSIAGTVAQATVTASTWIGNAQTGCNGVEPLMCLCIPHTRTPSHSPSISPTSSKPSVSPTSSKPSGSPSRKPSASPSSSKPSSSPSRKPSASPTQYDPQCYIYNASVAVSSGYTLTTVAIPSTAYSGIPICYVSLGGTVTHTDAIFGGCSVFNSGSSTTVSPYNAVRFPPYSATSGTQTFNIAICIY